METRIRDNISKKTKDFNREIDVRWPTKLQMELTNFCNHKCEFCYIPSIERPMKSIDSDLAKHILTQAHELGTTDIGLTAGAEPLMYKKIDEVIKFCKEDMKFDYVWITTNGINASKERWENLLRSGLDSIKVSINGGDRETYKRVHGADHFDRVVSTVNYLISLKEKYDFYLGISSVDMDSTRESLRNIKTLFGDGPNEIYTYPVINQSGQMTTYPSYRSEYAKCNTPFDSMTITSHGYYRLCCGDMTNHTAIYDLKVTSLKDAFYGKRSRDIRKRHIEDNLKGTLCHRCIYNSSEEVSPLNPSLVSGKLSF